MVDQNLRREDPPLSARAVYDRGDDRVCGLV